MNARSLKPPHTVSDTAWRAGTISCRHPQAHKFRVIRDEPASAKMAANISATGGSPYKKRSGTVCLLDMRTGESYPAPMNILTKGHSEICTKTHNSLFLHTISLKVIILPHRISLSAGQ